MSTPSLSPRKRKAPSRYGNYEEGTEDGEEDGNISDGWNDKDNSLDEDLTAETMKAEFGKMTVEGQESFDQDVWNLQSLLTLDPTKTYAVEDLDNDQILERALKLLYLSRFGREWLYSRISPHIRYDKLPSSMAKAIEDRLNVEEQVIVGALAMVKESDPL